MTDIRRHGSRALAGVAIRSLSSVVVVLVAYYTLPLNWNSEATTLLGLMLAVVATLAVVGWQLRSIAQADTPVLRAVEGLAVSVTVAVVVFALGYVRMARSDPSAFSETLGRTDALYFTVSTLATVGFGDIHPRSEVARVLVMLQMVFNVTVIGASVQLIVRTARRHAGDQQE